MTVTDGLIELYETYGYYREGLESLTLKGKDGVEQIAAILSDFRNNPASEIAGRRVLENEDYGSGVKTLVGSGEQEYITLPKSNVIKYKLENGAWVCLRPSGTEPKIKFYFGVKEGSLEESARMLEELKRNVMGRVESILR